MTAPDVWQARLLDVLAALPVADVAHDMAHLRRVLGLARRIALEEGPHDPMVVTAAALLHDLVSLPKDQPDRASASRMAAAEALRLLRSMGFEERLLPGVSHAIEAHAFSAGIAPDTPEARALQDADRLDALGAIGIARCFAVGGSLGRALVDPDDPLAERRALDDAAWVLDHFQTKLLRLPGTMTTATGRRLAEERAAFVGAFMLRMAEECADPSPGRGGG